MEKTRRSAKFKTQAVLELLRVESKEDICHKYAITMAELSAWRDKLWKMEPRDSRRSLTTQNWLMPKGA